MNSKSKDADEWKNGEDKLSNHYAPSSKNDKVPVIGIRHLQSLLLSLCTFSGYLLRVNISVAIVAMTGDTTKDKEEIPVFDWDQKTKSMILSSFFVGYLIMNIPAGIIGNYVNNKRLLIISFTVVSLLSLITPYVLIQTRRWEIFVSIRILQGMFQAFMMPITHGIIAQWAPPHERSFIVGCILNGIPLGTTTILATSGILANTAVGWPLIFYVTGGVGLTWVVLWSFLGSNSPSTSTFISDTELSYIENALNSNPHHKKQLKTPWLSIATSLPVWALTVTHIGYNWGFWLLLSEMPTYLNSALGINIATDGLLSALPYLSMWIVQFPIMYISDTLARKGILSITICRKLWNSIGMWGGCVSLLVLGYLGNDPEVAVLLYIVAVTISCCCNVGLCINHMDLSSNYAGILMGITNTFAATGGIGAPLIVAGFVTDEKSVTQWRSAFYTGAGILGLSNLVFLIFGSGKTQPWNDDRKNTAQIDDQPYFINPDATKL